MLRVLWCRAGMEMDPGLESVMMDGKVDGDVLLRDLEGRSLWFARWRDITLSQGLETQSAVLDQSCNRHHKSPSQKPPTKAYS